MFLSQWFINSYENSTKHSKRQKKNKLPKRLLLAKFKKNKKLYLDSIKLNPPNSEMLGEIKVNTKRVEISTILVMWIISSTNQHLH